MTDEIPKDWLAQANRIFDSYLRRLKERDEARAEVAQLRAALRVVGGYEAASNGRLAVVSLDGGPEEIGWVHVERRVDGYVSWWRVALPRFINDPALVGAKLRVRVGGLWGEPREGRAVLATTPAEADRGETVLLGEGPLEKPDDLP
jgi:hypothetical protein